MSFIYNLCIKEHIEDAVVCDACGDLFKMIDTQKKPKNALNKDVTSCSIQMET